MFSLIPPWIRDEPHPDDGPVVCEHLKDEPDVRGDDECVYCHPEQETAV